MKLRRLFSAVLVAGLFSVPIAGLAPLASAAQDTQPPADPQPVAPPANAEQPIEAAPGDAAGVQPPPAPAPITAAAAISVDIRTNKVLFARNARKQVPPASTTKIITALVARDTYALAQPIAAPEGVQGVGGGALGIKPGMTFTLEQLLYATMLRSANDAAWVLAAAHPNGYDAFIALMNAKARSLGAFDSNFTNPHGLDAEGHYSTARDMAAFGRQLLLDPVLAQIAKTPSYSLAWPDGTKRNFSNHNKLLLQQPDRIFGIKTGYTRLAGRCLVAAANTSRGVVLTVVLNSTDHYADTQNLLAMAEVAPQSNEGSTEEAAAAADAKVPEPVRLAAPPPAPQQSLSITEQVSEKVNAMMAVLAAAMLLLVARIRRGAPVDEAARFFGFLEPLTQKSRRS